MKVKLAGEQRDKSRMLCGMLDNALYLTVNNECEADTVRFVNYDE